MIKIILSVVLAAQASLACRSASFGNKTERFVVKSFDFEVKGGQFFTRNKGIAKTALVLSPELIPLKWVSKFASVTFSQIGPDLPFGGMNEEGLTVEALWLSDTKVPAASKKPAVNEAQYIQYLLDSAHTVDEALALTKEVQIEKAIAPIHYFICDKQEECAVVQLTESGIKSEKVVAPEHQVIENIVHAEMIKPETSNRIRDSFLSHRKNIKASVSTAFQWLDKVKTSGWSRWQIVYDVKSKQVHFQHLNPKGQAGSRWTVKVKNPSAADKAIVFAADGAQKWKKSILDSNLSEFSTVFPQLKPLIPVIHKYLEKSY